MSIVPVCRMTLAVQEHYLNELMIHKGEMTLKIFQLAIELLWSSIGQQILDIEIK